MKYKTVFVTERSPRHQQSALDAAPDMLDITMLREPNRDVLKQALSDAVYFISERRGAIDADLLEAAPQLELILRIGMQTYDIDVAAASERNVAVCYWPAKMVARVAEHTIMQMLVLIKKLNETQRIALEASSEWGESRRTDENTFAYNWSNRFDIGGLMDKRIGLIGFGEIGFEMTRRFQGWSCELLYYKRSRLPASVEAQYNLTYTEPDDMFRASDVLVNLLPYYPETDSYINAEKFALMPSGSLVVSTGSGSVIDEADLAQAIASGHLGGCAIDSHEYEPIKSTNPLLALAREGYNVLLTPHVAAGHVPNDTELADQYTDIIRHIENKPLINKVTHG